MNSSQPPSLTRSSQPGGRTRVRPAHRISRLPPDLPTWRSIAGNRVLAFDPWTLQVLAAHRGRQQLPAGCDGYVFARPGGRPYPPGYLTRRFAKLVRREGLPPIRLHNLRHGAATLALAGGAGLKVIQAMLGHASIILTADTYTSVLPDLARATADAVAAQILTARPDTPGLTAAPPWPHAPATLSPAGVRNRRPGPVGRQGVEP